MSDSSAPSTSETTFASIQNLNEDALVEVLQYIRSSSDVTRLRGVSKKFKKIIHARANIFARPKVNALRLSAEYQAPPSHQIGRFRPWTNPSTYIFKVSLAKKTRSMPLILHSIPIANVTMAPASMDSDMFDAVASALRRFVVDGELIFRNIVIDEMLLSLFMKPFVELHQIRKIQISNCFISASMLSMAQFIRRTICEDLTVEYCNGAEKVICDTVITSMTNLKKLVALPNPGQRFTELTNAVLTHWESVQSIPPLSVEFINCFTALTADGVHAFLRVLQLYSANRAFPVVIFDFGTVAMHPADISYFVRALGKFSFKHNVDMAAGTFAIATNLHPTPIAMSSNVAHLINNILMAGSKQVKANRVNLCMLARPEVAPTFPHKALYGKLGPVSPYGTPVRVN